MKSVYLDYRGREWTITDDAYEQIAEIIRASLVCSTCGNGYTEDSPQVAQNTCLSCFLLREQRHGITFIDQVDTQFRFIDPHGDIRLSDINSAESRVSVAETIRYHGFPLPQTIILEGEAKVLNPWYWQIHGEKTRSCVVLQHGSNYGSETYLFLACKNGSYVELNKRKRAHRELFQRAENQIDASRESGGYYNINGRRFYGKYESTTYEVLAEISSIEFDVSGKVLE